jgi:hypothetical protein
LSLKSLHGTDDAMYGNFLFMRFLKIIIVIIIAEIGLKVLTVYGYMDKFYYAAEPYSSLLLKQS